MHRLALCWIAVTLLGTGCGGFLRGQALQTTSGILARAQPSLQQESDYELAARAIPGALKTIEGFWIVDPDKASQLVPVLTEGFCQYGTAFVEDEWEIAVFAKKLDEAAYHNTRATKMFMRCLNYALTTLGPDFQKDLFASNEVAAARIQRTDDRTALMWAAFGLGSIIFHNLGNPDMLALRGTVQRMMEHVIELDAKNPPGDLQLAALPHVGLGQLYGALSPALGGDPAKAATEFQIALKITNNKFLLARALWGYSGRTSNNQKLFHEQLKQVLETPPSVWPEQRLANEVAHRRARRYLSHEKEWFQ
ncbi:MAG TPA: TRAP transporter TatT component family protein [Kofleriaceae bacterium]|jgi:hypothetical protein|nr:TRAP transporter TatT component family protein [Kofleriaceae bacterium]